MTKAKSEKSKTKAKSEKTAEKTKIGDFIELDFTARVKNGNVFDTTMEHEAKKAGLLREEEKEEQKRKFEPVKLCIGQDMILRGLDVRLADKEIGKEYKIELEPKEAFGKRSPKLIKIISLGSFLKKGMTPAPGEFVNINDMVAKIMSVSGGRVVVDFNNPLADKVIVYKIKIRRKILNEKEKIDALARFYFKNYEISPAGGKFDLLVKGKKIDIIDKKIKEIFPEIVIKYS